MARDGSPFDHDRPATALGLEQGCAACLFHQPRPIAFLMPSYPIDYRRRRAAFRQWNWLRLFISHYGWRSRREQFLPSKEVAWFRIQRMSHFEVLSQTLYDLVTASSIGQFSSGLIALANR
ncbi:unnamed protein product [Clonostachys chloroleuca]|uniref:Uncharacterized protein n=1 Tax=Clonostachys chloroleuca TaxID=1926264 RepID=A0AA35MIM8_9HYPO|nr:unnamed protein product [Clonostachys chloroleuca]